MAADVPRKTALITGAAVRIGRQLALDLAADGWSVAVHYNSSRAEALETVAGVEAAGARGVAIAGDLAQPATAERVVGEAGAALGPLSLLVNNASLFEPDEASTVTAGSWDMHMNTNLRAPVLLAQAFAAQLPAGETGNIVNLIDQRVLKLNPKFFSYTLSKSGLWTATRTMAQAFAPHIRVNAIGPGPALPNSRMDEADLDQQASLTLLQRGTSPAELSAALRFILAAPALTGQMIVLDGGQHLTWQTPDITDVNE